MRFKVTSKIAAGLAIILLIGLLSMLLIYRGLSTVEQDVRKLADLEEPTSAAAYEMEINVNGMGLAVLKYLDNLNPQYLHWVNDDIADFKRFHATYLRLTHTPKEKQLGQTIAALFNRFEALGKALIDRRNDQEALFTAVADNVEKIDDIIDTQIQPSIDRQDLDGFSKVEASLDMEADIAELGFWAANYQRAPKRKYKEMIFEEKEEFQQGLAQFKSLSLGPAEVQSAAALQGIFDEMISLVTEILALEEDLGKNRQEFIDLREEMDRLLDDEIQILALQDLYAPRIEASQATAYVLQAIRYLIPLFILAAIGVGILFIRTINRPLKKLMQGTQTIGHGDLSCRIAVQGGDEFAELSKQFNSMVDQLQITLVSKELLEKSEGKLHDTVAELRREITERERAERERAALQAALRRSEAMFAMGSLVAGVAHETRNPLFAISSTLDAMDARFSISEGYQRYTRVLHEAVDRLAKLMNELLDYGKPTISEFLPGAIKEIIAEAVNACAPLASQRRIKVINAVQTELAPISMDRARLVQVFQNLLENAIRLSPSGEAITLEATELHDAGQAWIACTVKDHGPGFREEDLASIFNPFFTRRRGGTGLGLAIVKRIVEEHGGDITAGNRPEGGAIMTVRLSLVRPSSKMEKDAP